MKIKRSLLLIATGILALNLAACSKKEEPEPTQYVPPVSAGYFKPEETTEPETEPITEETIPETEPETQPTEPELTYIEQLKAEQEGPNKDMYYKYQLLGDVQKELYLIICDSINSGNKNVAVPADMMIDIDSTREAVKAIWYDHPEYFWYSGKYEISFDSTKNNRVIELELDFYDLAATKDKLESNRKVFDKAVDTLIARAADKTIPEKERMFHDYICKSTVYEEGPYDQSAYSCLIGRKTVCAGYSRAFQILMMKSGIVCYTVTGDMQTADNVQAHAWNIVQISDGYYAVDLTSNDCDEKQCVLYNSYNFAYADFENTYTLDEDSLVYPDCNDNRYSFESMYGIEKNLASALSYTDSETIIYSLDEFKTFHESVISNNGFGEYTIKYVVVGEQVMDEIIQYIQNGEYINTYVSDVADREGYNTCTIQEDTTKTIFDGVFGIAHTIKLTAEEVPQESSENIN